MSTCNACGNELLVDVNWRASDERNGDYKCKSCQNKRMRNYKHTAGINKPMSENKSCTVFLGVYVAERVLKHAFKDVEVMPYGHKGYDFICNKGKKIDVKSGCMMKDVGIGRWRFSISRNTIADYFLCIAFDDREDLNPLHIWMIPSEKVRHLKCISIAKSNTVKWDEYRIDVTKVIECCNELKNITKEEII